MEVFVVAVVLCVISWVIYKYKHGATEHAIRGPSGYPLVGSALELTPDNIYDKFYGFAKQYGDVFQIRIFQTTQFVINSADLVHQAFCGEQYKADFNGRPKMFFTEKFYHGAQTLAFYKTVDDGVHNGLRKALAKSFHVYGDGIPVFEERVTKELTKLVHHLESLNGQEFEVQQLLRDSLSNIMSILLIGEPTEEDDIIAFWDLLMYQDYFMNPVTNSILSTFPFLVRVPGGYKRRYDEVLASRQRIVDKYFNKQKATRKPGKVRGIVDWYLEKQEEEIIQGREPFLTDVRIACNILEIILAGTVTTMSVVSSTVVCLLNHPNYQKTIQDELDNVVGDGRFPSIADRRSCNFIEAVLMESQRYIPTAPFLAPHVTSRDVTFEGNNIKANTMVLANIWYIHHDEKIWGDPWVFRPERFLDENGEIVPNTHTFRKSWIPFGTGRRQCPGQGLAMSRLFLFMGFIFQRFTLIPSKNGCPPCDPRTDEFDKNITVRPKPFHCRAVKRVS